MTPSRRHLRLALSIACLSLGLAATAPGAIGQASATAASSPTAHAAAYYLTGIGDEHAEMFGNPLWRQLHTKIARYIAPYDAAEHPYSLDQATTWIHDAEAQHQQVLVSFYHSEYTPTKLPSIASYQRAVKRFVQLFPRVHQYESWDEANRGYVPHAFSSPSAVAAAKYYQALIRVCKGCTVIGLDVLDQYDISPTLDYISEFKREIRHLQTIMPRIWGLHNYSDVNRLESFRTHQLTRALGGQVWLTETGGIVQFGSEFSNRHGTGLTRAAKVIKYMFAVAASIPQIKRLYVYDWTGGANATRFDAGLTNAHNKPRPGYVVLCRVLHGTDCNVKVVKN